MTSVTKQFRTETAHRLLNHSGRCKNVHGHSYNWQITLASPNLMLNGMIIDFGDLKRKAGAVIDNYDHTLVLQDNDPIYSVLQYSDLRIMTMPMPPTAENFCFLVQRQLKEIFPSFSVKVRVWETETSYAEYAN